MPEQELVTHHISEKLNQNIKLMREFNNKPWAEYRHPGGGYRKLMKPTTDLILFTPPDYDDDNDDDDDDDDDDMMMTEVARLTARVFFSFFNLWDLIMEYLHYSLSQYLLLHCYLQLKVMGLCILNS